MAAATVCLSPDGQLVALLDVRGQHIDYLVKEVADIVVVNISEKQQKFCHACDRITDADPICCTTCKSVHYCSEKCAWSNVDKHSVDCDSMRRLKAINAVNKQIPNQNIEAYPGWRRRWRGRNWWRPGRYNPWWNLYPPYPYTYSKDSRLHSVGTQAQDPKWYFNPANSMADIAQSLKKLRISNVDKLEQGFDIVPDFEGDVGKFRWIQKK